MTPAIEQAVLLEVNQQDQERKVGMCQMGFDPVELAENIRWIAALGRQARVADQTGQWVNPEQPLACGHGIDNSDRVLGQECLQLGIELVEMARLDFVNVRAVKTVDMERADFDS